MKSILYGAILGGLLGVTISIGVGMHKVDNRLGELVIKLEDIVTKVKKIEKEMK